MTRPYLIVTSGRTGSSILAHALQQTGRHGTPDEHLTVGDMDGWADRLGVESPLQGGSMVNYVAAVRAATESPDGGFGTKLQTSAIPMMGRFLASEPGAPSDDPAALLAWAFPHSVVIWSRRRDRVAVAVSGWRARESGEWAQAEAGPAAARPPAGEPSVEEISEIHRALHVTDLSIPGVLARTQMPVHEVVYEDLVADWDGSLEAVRRFLGEEGPVPPSPPPTLARQADERTDSIIGRWVAATGGCEACGRVSSVRR